MGWLKDLFKGKEKKGQMSYAESMAGYTPHFTSFGDNVTASELVMASIRLKAEFFSKHAPRYIKTENGKQIVITDHNIAKLLKNPNDYSTMTDFLYKAFFLRAVTKNCFIYPERFKTKGGEIKYNAMHILMPKAWRIYEYTDGTRRIGFDFDGVTGEVIFGFNEIIIWKKDYEFSEFVGGGEGDASERDRLNNLQAYHTICESIAEAAKCACHFDGILKVNAYAQEEEKVQEIRNKFIADLRANKGGVAVLDNGAEWQDKKRNIAFVDEKTMSHFEKHILMHEGVSMAMLLGDFTSAQKEAFYERCLERPAISFGQEFTKYFFSQWQQTNGSEIVMYPKKIQLMSTSETTNIVQATIAAGIWTKDEIREMYGYPPTEGGNAMPRGYNNIDDAGAAPSMEGANANN